MEICSLVFKYHQHITRPFALFYVVMYLLVCNNNHDLQRLGIFWELMIWVGDPKLHAETINQPTSP